MIYSRPSCGPDRRAFEKAARAAIRPSTRVVVGRIANRGRQTGAATRRKDVIRLIITEGQRFPKLAEVYYHEVIERVVPVMRAWCARHAWKAARATRTRRLLTSE